MLLKKTDELALGIDAGGTYTDAVVYSLGTGAVLAKAKSPTTRPDPGPGIAAALDQLRFPDWASLSFVSLSTTFATNAIVEGRYRPAGLILLGYPSFVYDAVDLEPKRHVAGRIDVEGNPVEPLDRGGLCQAVEELLREEICAVAVSGIFSVENPVHEMEAADLIREAYRLPVVQGHHLSMALDARARAVTARLNAGLLPLIEQLIDRVAAALARLGVTAPLCLVKGDGSLVSAAFGRSRPVELILSGPAASVVGGRHLAERALGAPLTSAVLTDIGGTTTDIGIIRGGVVRVCGEGAKVGAYQTHVEAVDVRTIGLGGDSYVQISPDGALRIGPQRVIPISRLAVDHPAVLDRLSELARVRSPSSLCSPCDFFVRLGPPARRRWTPAEERILDRLADGPAERGDLARAVGCGHPSLLAVERLEESGCILRSALTPTDALAALGRFDLWPADAANAALALYARRLRTSPEAAAEAVLYEVYLALAAQTLLHSADVGTRFQELGLGPERWCEFIEQVLRNGSAGDGGLIVRFELPAPVILVGGPAECLAEGVRKVLPGRVVTVEHGEVANAIGAVVGNVVVRLTGEITIDQNERYYVHVEDGRFEFEDLVSAKEFAHRHLTDHASRRLAEAGGCLGEIQVDVRDHFGRLRGPEVQEEVYLRTSLSARAVGRPAVGRG